MDANTTCNQRNCLPTGVSPAPVYPSKDRLALQPCLLMRTEGGKFQPVLLRSHPLLDVLAGALCDWKGEVVTWLEITVQSIHQIVARHSDQMEQITNQYLDQLWANDLCFLSKQTEKELIHSPFEAQNPRPLLIKPATNGSPFCETSFLDWELCRDEPILSKHGLPGYGNSNQRFLHTLNESPKMFAACHDLFPDSPFVVGLDRINKPQDGGFVFNPQAGLIRIQRHHPLSLENLTAIIEGQPWLTPPDQDKIYGCGSTLDSLRQWSHDPKGMPYRLYRKEQAQASECESLFIKLSLLLETFQCVRRYTAAHQLPLLNIQPESFGIRLADSGFLPRLWSAGCVLTRPGQAYPLEIKSTEQKYFIRMGKINPSPYIPEGIGAHSLGIGRIQIRSVEEETDGVVINGTLVADDYLGLDPHDILWFKLPSTEQSLEFFAHIFQPENRNHKETKFRTIPSRLDPETIQKLAKSVGTYHPKSPYEVWPLLSSPSDLYSLAVLGVRLVLCGSDSELPSVLDETLSLARQFGEKCEKAEELPAALRQHFAAFPKGSQPPATVRMPDLPEPDLSLRIMCNLLRMFPGVGKFSYCKSFGDVSPLALESPYEVPVHELTLELNLLQSLLITSPINNREVAGVLREMLSA